MEGREHCLKECRSEIERIKTIVPPFVNATIDRHEDDEPLPLALERGTVILKLLFGKPNLVRQCSGFRAFVHLTRAVLRVISYRLGGDTHVADRRQEPRLAVEQQPPSRVLNPTGGRR